MTRILPHFLRRSYGARLVVHATHAGSLADWPTATIDDLCRCVRTLDDEAKREVFRALGGMTGVLRFMPDMPEEPGDEPEPIL